MLTNYKIRFNGRLKNARGIFYTIEEVTFLDPSMPANGASISLLLYDKYEHIMSLEYLDNKEWFAAPLNYSYE